MREHELNKHGRVSDDSTYLGTRCLMKMPGDYFRHKPVAMLIPMTIMKEIHLRRRPAVQIDDPNRGR